MIEKNQGRNTVDWSDIFFVLLIVFAIGLRFFNLDSESLWSDELFTVASALNVGASTDWYSIIPKIIPELSYQDSFLTWKAADNTPPLFEFLLIGWVLLFGDSDYALRSLPALFGVLTPVVFYLGLRNHIGKLNCLLGVTLLVFSPALIMYSQEVRAYILSCFLGTVSLVWVTRSILNKKYESISNQKDNNVWGGVGLLTVLSYSHYTGLVTAGLLAAIYLLMVSIPSRRYSDILRFLLVPLFVLPWIVISYKAFTFSSNGGFAWMEYGYDYIPTMVSRSIYFHFPFPYEAFKYVAPSLVLLMTGYAVYRAWNTAHIDQIAKKELPRTLVYVTILLLVALIVYFGYTVYSAFTAKMWHQRYFFAPTSILALLLSLVFSSIFLPKRAVIAINISFAIFMGHMAVKYIASPWDKENYRESVRYISEQISNDDDVILGWKPNSAYYLHYLEKFVDESLVYNSIPVSYESDIKSYCMENSSKQYNAAKLLFLIKNTLHSPYQQWLSECSGLRLVETIKAGGDKIIVYKFSFIGQ